MGEQYTDEEFAAIVRHTVSEAKDKISRAGARSVDIYARYAVRKLRDLGANEEAQEVYDYYMEIWGL